MRLQRVDPPHQQVEQPVAHRPVRRCLGQGRLVRQAAEADQDRGAAGEPLARARQRQAGGARGRGNADRAPALLRRHLERGSDQRAVECGVVHGCIMAVNRRLGHPKHPVGVRAAGLLEMLRYLAIIC